ncbi:hypothetical protein HZC31_03610 [Candidatus Woesearchaeota archaeon]|nr:hypothetical protein [Candidatus Woesearchaeota archaeon]
MVFVLSEKRVIKTWSNQIHSCYPFNKVVSWVLLLFCLYFALFLFVLPTAHADSINTAAVDGIVVYQEAVVQTPLYRIWNDSNKNFSEERTNTNAVGGLINFVVLKANHERDEMILGTEDQQADVNIQIINQTKNFTNLLEVSTSVDITSTRGFDIAYEDISGDALIVYENSGTVDAVFGYRIWNGTGYSSEVNITTPMLAGTGSPLRWVSLYPKRSSDDIMVLLHNNAGDLYAVLWNGSDFELNSGVNLSITTTTAVSEHFAFAWETASGDGLALYGTGTAVVRRNYTSATKTWGAEESESVGNGIDHLTVCSHPTNDYVGIIFVDGGADLNVRIWNGSRILSNSPTEDGTVETGGANNINIDCVWNGTNGNVAIFGFTDSNSLNLSYALFAVQNESWSATTLLSSIQTQDFASDDIQGLTFTKHPTTHEIMVVAEDLLEDITAIVWNGTGFQNISASPLETNTEVLNGGQNGVQFAWYQFDPAPNVTALVANPGTVPAAGIVNITVNVTDTIGVDVVLVNITHANGTVEQFRMTNGTGATPQFFNLTFLNTNDQGNFTVVIIANDTSTHKNINDTVQTTFTVDSTAPAVATLRPVFGSSQLNGSVINISATVTDAFQSVDSVRANISYINCILLLCTTKQETFLLQKVGNIYNYSFANTTDISEYNITFIANDTVGNLNITEKTNVSLINQDNFNPSLTSLRPAANSFTARNSVVNISATVTDNIGISITVANVTYPNNATTEQLLLIGVGSIFNYSFGNTSNEGYYNITFIATDLLGNINATEKTNVTVDSTGPAVANVQPVLESTEINGTIINISARVTDEWLNVDIVLANITYPDNTTKEQIRLQKTGNIYNYSFGNTTQNGIYNITFIANDTAGNLNFTQKTNVTMVVQDVINPVVTTLRPVANSFTARNSVVNMSANVTDNGGINTVFANVTYPNNATTEQLLLISFGSIFNYSFGNTSAEGYYNITFTATDLLGNINATEKTNVTVDRI